MTEKHLTENEIQQYILNEFAASEPFKKHLQSCAQCQAIAEVYAALFSTIKQEKKPVFDFDVTDFVIAQLPEPVAKKTTPSLLWPLLSAAFGFIPVAIWIFEKVFPNVFTNLSAIAIYLIIISAVLLLIFQVLDLYWQNQRQLNLLNSF